MSTPASLLDRWRDTRDGFAPFFCEPVLRLAFEHLEDGLSPGAVVLDVGCGSGHLVGALRRAGYRAAGCDVHFPTLRSGRESYPAEHVFVASAERLPLPANSVDALFSFSVMQYVDRAAALSECSRVLRPGGRFAIVENLAANPVARAYRLGWRLAGRRYAENLHPREHLAWRDRGVYGSYFSEVSYEGFYLLTPLLLASRTIRSAPAGDPDGSAARRLFRAIHRSERWLTRALPPVRAACWNLLVYGTR